MKTIHCSVTPKCKGDKYSIVIDFDQSNADLFLAFCKQYDFYPVDFVKTALASLFEYLNDLSSEVSEA